MKIHIQKRVLTVLLVADAVAATMGATQAPADRTRTVYISATDAKGAPVTDLTAADVTVKEGGKDQKIANLKAATAPMHVAIVVDDDGTGVFQNTVGQFIQATTAHAKFSIRLLDPWVTTLCDYTEDVSALQTALGRLGRRAQVPQEQGGDLGPAISGAVKELEKLKAERPVILVLTVGGEASQSKQSSVGVPLDELKNSGAGLYTIFLRGGDSSILGDGPKESGGIGEGFGNKAGIPATLAKILDRLTHQYALSYTLPDGVKMGDRLIVETSRKGVVLVAPTRIPDK